MNKEAHVLDKHQIKAIMSYSEDIHLQVLKAFLIEGKSHREIQRSILGLPAPDHGGGFITMNILHYYHIYGNQKGLLKNKDINDILPILTKETSDTLQKLKRFTDYENKIKLKIENKNYNFYDKNTEYTREVKIRINQNVLRDIILDAYKNECALCEINTKDLLVCSHIIPWREDEKNRLNPKNAICFCVLHDKLFDKGYFSFDDNCNIILSRFTDKNLLKFLTGFKFKFPKKYTPEMMFIQSHRNRVLQK